MMTAYDLQKLQAETPEFAKLPITVDEEGGLTIDEVRGRSRAMTKKKGVKMIVVDYLQLMGAKKEKGRNREQEISEVSRGLKALAKELDIPIIALIGVLKNKKKVRYRNCQTLENRGQ